MQEVTLEDKLFPVVGIGCSAGGLSALKEFFSALPETENDMAFVLIQHLSPDHKSNLVNLIGQYTWMQTEEVEDEMVIKSKHVYVIPPNRQMVLRQGKLHLSQPTTARGIKLPIDYFFYSLGQELKEKAVCVLLSGAGTDGTLGLKAVKAEGGLAIVQEPKTAGYDSMLRSAISTGAVDYVLHPGEMAEKLLGYVQYPISQARPQADSVPPPEPDLLQEVHNLLRAQVGHDFSYYKENTIRRRIERRMALKQIVHLEEYVRYLRNNPAEIRALFQDILVGVTSFFRDLELFAFLQERVIPELFREKKPGSSVRIWVPGCATGEEAYSLAILVQEYLETIQLYYKVYIFATDIDAKAIEKARGGAFPASLVADISPERLQRFFHNDSEGNTFFINKTIRDMVIFAEQNVVEDPPFTKLDLISCRNLLIFVNDDTQKKLLHLFHYSLNKNGFLVLGSSETVGDLTEFFEALDRSHKVYRRLGAGDYPRPAIEGFFSPPRETITPARSQRRLREDPKSGGIRDAVEKKLLQDRTPPSVVVNDRGDIHYIHGRTGNYLELAPGQTSMNIIQMARDEIRQELREGIRQVAANKENVHYQGLRVRHNSDTITVNLTVSPIEEAHAPYHGLILVMFEETPAFEKQAPSDKPEVADVPAAAKDKRIVDLEEELREKEQQLQSALEELETSTEELQSVNEEYQSTNEELETSQEELQSVNEELTTVNAELEQKVKELTQANNDMKNMLAGTGVGTIFVDLSLRIIRFTPPISAILNLLETDIGRPLEHFSFKQLHYDNLTRDVQWVLDTLETRENEVKTVDDRWYLVRILPYRTVENAVEGAVITFIEITEKKRLEEGLRRMAVVVRDSSDAVAMLDFDGRILAWNPQAERLFGWQESEALELCIWDITPEEEQEVMKQVMSRLVQNTPIEPVATRRITKTGNEVDIVLTASVLLDEEDKPYAIATTERPARANEG